MLDAVDDARIDPVHQPAKYLDHSHAQHGEDRDRNGEPGDWVGGVVSGPDAECAEHDRE